MDFVGKRRWFFLLSGILIIAGIISILIPPAFRFGIEFTGGTVLTLTFEDSVEQESLSSLMSDLGHKEAVIQKLGDKSFLVRTKTLQEPIQENEPSEREQIEEAIDSEIGNVILEGAAVSPIVANETVRNAIIAILFASLAILFYISWAFRLVPNSFRMGTTAIIAAIHDVLIVVGLFSILGKVIDIEINAMFITGVLTVVGYSVHDTSVVFDRIRENTARRISRDIVTTVNMSIMETIGRSLTTSITTLIVILAIFLLGGNTLNSLLVTLVIGIITGTYSSIFVASQLLVVWEQKPIFGNRGTTIEN